MSLLDLSDIPKERASSLTSEQLTGHFFAISTNEKERAENFQIIMDKARDFGVSDEVYQHYQEQAPIWRAPELWEKPRPFGKKVKLAEFPLSCLPEMLSEYLEAVANYVQVFPEMAALPLLSVLSLCAQGKAIIKHPGNDHTEPLNLYTMTIAAPGERKTGSFKEFMRPVKEYQDYYNEANKYRVNEYKATKNFLESQKLTYMKGKNANLEKVKEISRQLADLEPVHELRLNVSDATPEALAWEMYLQGGKIGVLGDEGAIFDVLSGLYSGGATNLNIFLEAYDGSDYSIIRRTKENIDLKNPLLTMGLMVQPELFTQAMNNQAFSGRGFIHRFLFSFPDSKAGYQNFRSKSIPIKLQEKYNTLVKRLLIMPVSSNPPIILSDNDATNLLNDYHNHLQEAMRTGGIFEDLKEWASKQFARCMKISGILHLCEHEPNELLSGQTALNGISIAMWTENHALKALSSEMLDTTEKDANYVLERIKTADKLELSKREILRLCRKFNAGEIAEPLGLLEDMGYIRYIQPPSGTKGRPSENYKINPLVYE